jgi:hypothetical protein
MVVTRLQFDGFIFVEFFLCAFSVLYNSLLNVVVTCGHVFSSP